MNGKQAPQNILLIEEIEEKLGFSENIIKLPRETYQKNK